jgi:hypothetical protein
MRANSTGPPCSAALVSISAARYDRRYVVVGFGNGLAQMSDASRRVVSRDGWFREI